ncbi:MAG: tetratricopeptide repeat protein [Chloroflexales bacterium]
MDPQLILLALAALAIGLLTSMLVIRRRKAPPPPGRPAMKTTIAVRRGGDGPSDDPVGPAPRRRWLAPTGTAAITLSLLILGAAGWLIYSRWDASSNDRFVVLVAPFDDGGDGQTGRNVAAALADEIAQRAAGAITVTVLDARPADAQAALSTATAQASDMLIWGRVEPGAMLDSESLTPQLVYTPNGAFAPNGWDGYLGRFAMPRSYAISSAPINGRAVLPLLVSALYDYGQSHPDQAATALGNLLADYPALNAPLPRAVRGNVFWARGSYGEAADEYRRALAAPADAQAIDRAMLANNLAAILLDAGDGGVLAAFSEAVRLLSLDTRDLGALRYNLGLLDLASQKPADATVELEQARNLLPANTPMLLSLAEAYRESGHLGSAEEALSAAAKQVGTDRRLVPETYRTMWGQLLDGATREQRGLIGLARSLNAQGPLAWEIEIAKPLPESDVADLRNQLRAAADAGDQTVSRWHQRSASDSATDPDAGQVAAGQADRVERDVRRQRFYLAVLDTELARARAGRPTSTLNKIFGALFGSTTPIADGLSILDALEQREPDSPSVLLAKARALRVSGQLNDADRTYDRVVQLASQRPEGYFGKGVIALDRGDAAAAVQLLRMAVDRNGAFFPGRFALAKIAEQTGNLAEAVAQLRAVSQQRPGPDAAVALAQALRLSGPAGFAEAEQVLLPLGVTSAAAAIELGRLYSDAGRADESIQAYRGALKLDPRSTTASFELGERLAAAGDLKGAEQALRDALRFDDANTSARLALARLYEGPLAQPDQADKEYAVALSHGVSDINALITIGDTALKNQNPTQAISAYTKAASLQPGSPLPQYKLAQAYLSTNRLQSAGDAAQQAINQTANTGDPALRELRAQAFVILGDVARRRGDLTKATDSYAQAQQIDPQLLTAQIGMGQVAVGQGQWGVALRYFEAAASLPGGVDSADAQFWLAEGLLRSGDLERATAAYRRATELQPTFPEALLGIAQVQSAQNNVDAALDTVGRSLAQRPSYAEALLFKGKLLQARGRTSEAMSAYDASIRSGGQIAESYYRRGLLLIHAEQYDSAVSDMRKAIALQPNFPEANYWLGRAYYAQGRLQSAHDSFRRAVDLNAAYSEALYYLGRAAENLGNRDEALNAYQTATQADGGGEWGARAREQLDRIQ